MRPLSRKPTNIKDGSDPFVKPYDAVICAHGFEERSCAFAERFVGKAQQRIALSFTDRQVLSFSRNAEVFEGLNYRLLALNERELASWWKEWLSTLRPDDPSTGRICIDISSQTRTRLALLVEGLCNYHGPARIDVDFVYSLAEFSEPGPGNEVAEVCGPVTPFFAGWPRDPDLPTAAIIGLGYETDRAIGAYEYLEPTNPPPPPTSWSGHPL